MFKIQAKTRLTAAKSLRELSDSSIQRIANDSSDKRSAQAKQELKRRRAQSSKKSKSSSKEMNPLMKGYKKLSRWNTKRRINTLNREEKNDLNTNNWFFGPTERDFEGKNKYERRRKLNDYINNRRREIHQQRDALTNKLDRLNRDLGD